MISTPPLTGSHLRTYQTIFQHPVSHNLARRIIGSLVMDEHHLTDAQLLAKAREFYANHRRS